MQSSLGSEETETLATVVLEEEILKDFLNSCKQFESIREHLGGEALRRFKG